MLVNKKNSNTSRVKFISYTGEYPNLCSGVLTLEIDEVFNENVEWGCCGGCI